MIMALEKILSPMMIISMDSQDEDALIYLYLANKLIHEFKPEAITIAEEMSGMPGIAAGIKSKGYGFDFRLSMGVPDFWIKLVKDTFDEAWDMGALMHELTQHRPEEKIISYCESHDQALVGDKTLIFRMIDADMYTGMNKDFHNLTIDRGIALHKMIQTFNFRNLTEADILILWEMSLDIPNG